MVLWCAWSKHHQSCIVSKAHAISDQILIPLVEYILFMIERDLPEQFSINSKLKNIWCSKLATWMPICQIKQELLDMVQLLIIPTLPQFNLSLGHNDEIYTDKNHISLPEAVHPLHFCLPCKPLSIGKLSAPIFKSVEHQLMPRPWTYSP